MKMLFLGIIFCAFAINAMLGMKALELEDLQKLESELLEKCP